MNGPMTLAQSMVFELYTPGSADAASPPAAHAPSTMEDLEARRIAQAVAKGNAEAFQVLYDRYHGRLFRLVLVLSRGQETLSHDVVQQTMLTAADRLKSVESEAHLWNWLARVARQVLLKEWRRLRQEPMVMDDAALGEFPAPAQPDTQLEETLDNALEKLAEPERRLIELFYLERASHAAIAEQLHTTPKAVSRRLERARTKLRAAFKHLLAHET